MAERREAGGVATTGPDEELRRSNRSLRTISRCNEVLVRASDEQQLLEDVCRAIIEQAGYAVAWVGFAEDEGDRSVVPVARAGRAAGFVEEVQVHAAGEERRRGPTGTAIRSGRTVVARDLVTDPVLRSWREAAERHGVVSAVALPLTVGARTIGALTVADGRAESFASPEVALLTEIAGDLAFGITTLRDRRQMERYAHRLEGLREIDGRMMKGASAEEVAGLAADWVERQVPANRVDVLRFEEGSEMATYLAVRQDRDLGPGTGDRRPLAELPHRERLAASTWYVPDLGAADSPGAGLDAEFAAGSRSVVFASLRPGADRFGAMFVHSVEAHAFDDEHLEVIREVADHLGIALRQAELREGLRLRAEELERLARERKLLVEKVVRAQEEERQRVSRELHDGLGQILTAVSLHAGVLQMKAPAALGEDAAEIQRLLTAAIAESRQIVWGLRPPELDRDGLVPVLARVAEAMRAAGDLHVELEDRTEGRRPSADIESVAFRIVQEALNNAVKHAGASSIRIVLTVDADAFAAEVSDDGRGFDPSSSTVGIGLLSMRERAELMGGSLQLVSEVGSGTTICLRLPTVEPAARTSP